MNSVRFFCKRENRPFVSVYCPSLYVDGLSQIGEVLGKFLTYHDGVWVVESVEDAYMIDKAIYANDVNNVDDLERYLKEEYGWDF